MRRSVDVTGLLALALAVSASACDGSGHGYVRGRVSAQGVAAAQVSVTGALGYGPADTVIADSSTEMDSTRTTPDGRYQLYFIRFLHRGPTLVRLRFLPDDTLLADTVLYTILDLDYGDPGITTVNMVLQPRP